MTSSEWRSQRQTEIQRVMRAQARELPRDVAEAVYTACSEIPDEHPDDILDCVCGMLPRTLFEEWIIEIRVRIGQLV